jgi:alanine dehydrogenase
MPILLLSEDEVRQLLTMEMALAAVEDVLRRHALEEAQNLPRMRCHADHTMLHTMSAAVKGLHMLGYKAYCTSRHGAQFHVGLYDARRAELIALIQADYLGQMRTGAASGVATHYMARPDAQEVGLYGSGKQARTQLLAVCRVRNVQRVQVFSPSEERRRRFCQEMSSECRCAVEPVARPELAARDKDIVITATSSREPVLYGDWLAEGTHLNVIGSNFLNKAEIDAIAVRRCQTVVVDSKDQARLEAGDLVPAIEEGSLRWADVHELGQVVVGRYVGRQQDITMFKSLGVALEDVAVAAKVYDKAITSGVGRMLEW